MIWMLVCTHFFPCHVICFGVNMMPMWHAWIFIAFIYAIWFSTRPSVLSILADILELFLNNDHAMIVMTNVCFWHICNIRNQTWPCILTIFFNWGGNSERNIESLIMKLSSSSLAYFIPPLSESLTILLWSYWIDTCNNNFGTSCGSVWPSTFTFRQSFTIYYYTTCGWCIIQL